MRCTNAIEVTRYLDGIGCTLLAVCCLPKLSATVCDSNEVKLLARAFAVAVAVAVATVECMIDGDYTQTRHDRAVRRR